MRVISGGSDPNREIKQNFPLSFVSIQKVYKEEVGDSVLLLCKVNNLGKHYFPRWFKWNSPDQFAAFWIFNKNLVLYWPDQTVWEIKSMQPWMFYLSSSVSIVFTFKSGSILFNWKLSGRNNISKTFSKSSTIRIPTWVSDKKCKHFKIKFYITTIDKDKFLILFLKCFSFSLSTFCQIIFPIPPSLHTH